MSGGPWLLICTAAPRGVVAVAQDDRVLAEVYLEETRRHAEALPEAARSVLGQADVAPLALTGIGAGRGPGSFIGVRVGLAFAQGWALSCGLRPQGVSSLAALAAGDGIPQGRGLAVLDARRGELYVAEVQRSASGEVTTGPAEPISPEACGRAASDRDFVVGHLGSTGERLADAWGPKWIALPGPTGLGLFRALRPHVLSPGPVLPDYCRLPDAKLPAP